MLTFSCIRSICRMKNLLHSWSTLRLYIRRNITTYLQQHLTGLMHLSISTMPMDGPRQGECEWVMGDVWMGRLAKHQKTNIQNSTEMAETNGSWDFCFFFLTTRVAWSFVEKKGCSILKLVVASTQDWYKILETMTLWHSDTKYRYKILSDHILECFMYGISKYSHWALLIDDVPWIFLWWLAWNRQLDDVTWVWRVNKYPVCDLLVAGCRCEALRKYDLGKVLLHSPEMYPEVCPTTCNIGKNINLSTK